MQPKASLIASVFGTVVFVGLLLWIIGTKIQAQALQLADQFPVVVEHAKSQLEKDPAGKKIIKYASSKASIKKYRNVATGFFKSTFGILGDVYVVLFIGIFFTSAPGLYKKAS